MIVKIDKMDHQGRGIAKVNGITTFVKDALIGEEVEIELVKEKKKYNEAKVIRIIKESDDRREVPCPYYELCGGCNIMHMNYGAQLEFKKEKVKNILSKYAGIEMEIDIVSSSEYSYRNKITLHQKDGVLGYKKEKSNDIINIDNCLIAEENINEYLKSVKDYNVEELIIRTNGKEVISSKDNKPLIMNINNLKFKIDINSFFQVNSYICSKVFDFILESIEEANTALDLYSGVCTLGILASKKARKVYSIEMNKYSYENAKENLKLNNINNVVLMNEKLEEEIKKIDEEVDLIISDLPRSGMDDFTINTILEKEPKQLIYMSCEPMTLARDLNILKKKYDIKKVKAFDMFANTYHVENVCLLMRKTQENFNK